MTRSTGSGLISGISRVRRRLGSGGLLAEMTQGAGKGAVVQAAAVALSFLLALLAARVLGAEDFGYYMYALTWVNVLVLVAKNGLDTIAMKFVAAYQQETHWAAVRGVSRRVLQGAVAASIVVVLLAYLAAVGLGSRAESFDEPTFLVCLVLVPLFALLRVIQGLMRGFRSVVRAKGPETIVRPLLVVLVLGYALTTGRHFGSVTLAVIHVVAGITALGLAFYWLRGLTPAAVRQAPPWFETRAWYAGAVPFALISSMSFLLKQSDIIIVGVLCEPHQLGVYVAASRVAQLTAFGLLAVNTVYAPMSAAAGVSADPQALRRITTHAARLIFAATLPIFVVLAVFGEGILSFFGPEYPSGMTVLVLLAVGQLVNAAAGPVGLLLGMNGLERQVAAVDFASVVVNVVLNIVLIARMGVVGAAIATAIAISARNLILVAVARRRLGFSATILG